MALISNEIIFDYPAPKAELIVEEVSKLTGLPVILLEPYCNEAEVDEDDEQDEGDELYEFIHRIAFKDFPDTMFDIYAYIPDAVNDLVAKEKQETGFDANWPSPVHGAYEKKGKQSIHIEGYLGMETTLFHVISEALKSMGGKSKCKKDKKTNKQDFPLTVEQLKQKHKKNKRWNWFVIILQIILLPILLPLALIKAIIGIIKMPFEINRGMKAIKKHYPEHFKDKK